MVKRAHQKVVARAVGMLQSAGYKIESGCGETVLDASSLGTPQKRRRHFLIASRRHPIDVHQAFEEVQCHPISAMEAIGDLSGVSNGRQFDRPSELSPENKRRTRYLIDNDLYDLPDEERPECHQDGQHSYQSVYGRIYPDKPAQTLTKGFTSPGRGRFTHPVEARGLTPHEGARLQGFPDDFAFMMKSGKELTRNAMVRLIGDAVPPQMGYAVGLARKIHERLPPNPDSAL